MEQPPKKSGAGKIILWVVLIIGGLGVVGALVCCGGGYFFFNKGMQMISEPIKAEVQDHPAVKQHIGDVTSFSMSLQATTQAAQKHQPSPGQQMMAFDIKGSKGSGIVIAIFTQRGEAVDLISATLETSSGEEIVLKGEMGSEGE